MLRIYDKAQWHIDGGEDANVVAEKLRSLFSFLAEKRLLDMEGREILEFGIDDSVSIHERMLTEEGNKFMILFYDQVMDKSAKEMAESLEKAYMEFCRSDGTITN